MKNHGMDLSRSPFCQDHELQTHMKFSGNLFGLGMVSRVRFIPSSRAAAKVVEDVCDEWVTERQSIKMLKVSGFTPKTQCEHT